MILRVLMTTTALAAVLAASEPVFAQQQGSGNQQRWTQEQAAGEGTQIRLSPAAIRLIQQALNQSGFDAGNLTGTWNGRTQQAASAYQAANNLEPTGTPTIALINAMGGFSVISGQYGEGQGQSGPQQRWTQETAAGEGVPLYASPAQVRLVQQALNSAGYDCGTVDGTWGPQTSQCARAFQAANNLEPNGRLTVALITALGGNQAIFTASQQGQQTGQRWTQETTAGQGTEIWASPATVRLVQQALNQAGYDAGSLDGNWSGRTARSAQAFQASNNLEPTGSLTTALLASIGMSQWYAGQVLAYNPSGGGQGSMQGSAGGQFGQGQQSGQGRFGGGQQSGQSQDQFGGGQQFGQGQGRFGGGQQFGQGQGRFGGGQQFGQGQGRFGGGQQFGQGQGQFGGGQQFGQGGQGQFGGGQQFGQGQGRFGGGQQFGQGGQGQQFGQGAQFGQGGGQFGQGRPQFGQGAQAGQGQNQFGGSRGQGSGQTGASSQQQQPQQGGGSGGGQGAGSPGQQQNQQESQTQQSEQQPAGRESGQSLQ